MMQTTLEILNTVWQHEITKVIRFGFIVWLAVLIINRMVHNFFKRTHFFEERKEQTIESMVRSVTKYVATFAFIIYTLDELFDIEAEKLLAGAGVAGIILGLGAQGLIKDVLSGVFLLYEKQLDKGDFITVNNTYNGTVEEIGLRFLKVREWSGKLLTISNGEIQQIQNYNIENMRVIERVVVSFRENPEEVFKLLEQTCVQLNDSLQAYLKTNNEQVIEPFQVYGMTSLNAGFRGYEYTIIGLVDDAHFWTAAKETRRIVAQAMFDHDILMAEGQLIVQNNQEMNDETSTRQFQ